MTTRRRSRGRRLPLRSALALAALLAAVPALAGGFLPGSEPPPRPLHALGTLVAPADLESDGSAAAEAAPDWWALDLHYPEAPERIGRALDAIEARSGEAGHVALVLGGLPADLPQGFDERARHDWLSWLRRVARATGPRVDWYVVDFLCACGDPGDPQAAARAAYELKSSAVTLGAEDPSAGIAVRVADEVEIGLLIAAYGQAGDLAPYVDALLLGPAAPGTTPARIETLAQRLLEVDPGSPLWVELPPGAGTDDTLARAAAALAAGADLVLLRGRPPLEYGRLARALAPDLGVAPVAGSGIEANGPRGWFRLFDEEKFEEHLVYWGAGAGEARFRLSSLGRRGYRVVDPATGKERLVPARPAGADRVEVTVPLERRPLVLIVTRRRTASAIPVEEEREEVRAATTVTAEEVIAAHQRFRAFQDDRLRTVRRPGRISFRPRYGQFTGTVDLTLEGQYFWEPSTGGEWVIENKYIDGVKLSWDKVPEIPLVKWERVIQEPLVLELDKRYRYELEGTEEIDGRDCWRLSFAPSDPDAPLSLHRGRAWIDRATAALVQVSSVQTNLAPPLISREETRLYRPFEGPDGTVYWLLDHLEGQIIQTVAGNNLVVLQEWRFGPPLINDERFLAARQEAYASRSQMLRDTGEGFKWLERTEEGGRVVKEAEAKQWFAVGGLLDDRGADELIPLAGFNYIDLDTFGGDELLNVFFAGAIANVTLSDPNFLGTRFDVAANLNAVAFAVTDKEYEQGAELPGRRVKRRTQSLSVRAGYPLGDFFKVRGTIDVDHVHFGSDDRTGEDPTGLLGPFTLPPDHFVYTGRLALAFDRAGWGFELRGARSRRSRWAPWGFAAELPAPADAERAKSYERYALVGQKTFFLKNFQELELSLDARWGKDLDRFSAYTFGFLTGSRLRGFGGSGLRYDRGLQAQLTYKFSVADFLRFEAVIEQARVDELRDGRRSTHTGTGIAANFPGPWQTLIRLDAGYALKSDIPEVEGDLEFLAVVLKLF